MLAASIVFNIRKKRLFKKIKRYTSKSVSDRKYLHKVVFINIILNHSFTCKQLIKINVFVDVYFCLSLWLFDIFFGNMFVFSILIYDLFLSRLGIFCIYITINTSYIDIKGVT